MGKATNCRGKGGSIGRSEPSAQLSPRAGRRAALEQHRMSELEVLLPPGRALTPLGSLGAAWQGGAGTGHQ